MKTQTTAYPFKRFRTAACFWDELEIIHPGETTLENLSEKWDYDVDIDVQVSVEISEKLLSPDQLELLDDTKLAVDAHCAVTMWRNFAVARADDQTEVGTRRYSAVVRIPGALVSQRLEIKPYLIAPMRVPFFNNEISQVIMADGPSSHLSLESSLAYFPTSILSFAEANWPSAPWKFELNPGTLDDLYVNSSRLYINSDKKIAATLSNAGGATLKTNAVTAITRDVMLATMMKLSTDVALREECRESNFASGSVGKVVSKQISDLFGRSLDSVITEFARDPSSLLVALDAGSNYFGRDS